MSFSNTLSSMKPQPHLLRLVTPTADDHREGQEPQSPSEPVFRSVRSRPLFRS
jgi:hypothetical protein